MAESTPESPAVETETFYSARVQPVFDAYCVLCHGPQKQADGLRLDSVEALLGSGKLDEVVPHMRRPLEAEGHMPPRGKPQPDADDIDAVAAWVGAGADPDWMPADAEAALGAEAGDALPPTRPWEEVAESVAIVNALGTLEVLPLAADNPALRVRAVARGAEVAAVDLAALGPLLGQVAWLDLGHARADDSVLALVPRMPHLERLYLQETSVTDAGLACLQGLPRLRYLNLCGTAVTDVGLEDLARVPALRQVYLFDTPVTEAGAQRLHDALYDAKTEEALLAEAEMLRDQAGALSVAVIRGQAVAPGHGQSEQP